MLTKLRVKNLKAWGEELWDEGVELAPITLFLGPNSAGKTSLLQVPLLLKQTFTSPDPNLDLNLGGQPTDLVDLGTYESLIHGNDTSRELGVGVSLLPTVDQTPDSIDYTVTYTGSGLAAAIQRLEFSSEGRRMATSRERGGDFTLEVDGRRFIGPVRPYRSFALSPHGYGRLGALGHWIQDLSFIFQREIAHIAYLGPLRDAPLRSYMWTGARPGDLGSRGERAVPALLASIDSYEGTGQSLIENVSRWMKNLGIADELVIERHGRSRYHELFVKSEGRKTNIMDVGFGISQVLPMLVLSQFVEEGTTIIAEQPELHLHPRAQVGLADLMVEVARERKVQFLAETHSEHLFRRLQTLISEEKLGHEECRLYFVDKDENGKTQLTHLEVDKFGRVKNWPKHFFGDAIGETERQTRKMLERIARERGKR